MPVEITSAAETLQSALSQAPTALLVIVLLGGPTAIWILYRLLTTPRRARYQGEESGLLWICHDCRSANDARRSHCYRCGFDREATMGDLDIVDGDGIVTLTGRTSLPGGTAVAITQPEPDPVPAPILAPGRPLSVDPGPGVAVGPGRPIAKRPRRAVTSRPTAPPPETTPDPAVAVPGPGLPDREAVAAGAVEDRAD